MNVTRSARISVILVGVTFWTGSVVAAPLTSHPRHPAALIAAIAQDEAPIERVSGDKAGTPDLQRQVVNYATTSAPGTIVVDTAHTYLYYVLRDGQAIRYGIGVGRDGFTWSGAQTVTRMAEWPDWTPPQEMIGRQPYLPRWMAGGESNPLGARAIYLGSTVYRIHGTNAPATIGTRVSSGCIRLTNADVTDLYGRVTVGTKIIVLSGEHGLTQTVARDMPSLATPSVIN
jgi:lipoprotein-anchoring transpeptidase ErfK/SrfK